LDGAGKGQQAHHGNNGSFLHLLSPIQSNLHPVNNHFSKVWKIGSPKSRAEASSLNTESSTSSRLYTSKPWKERSLYPYGFPTIGKLLFGATSATS
jgi:hypothetical protein